MKNRSEQGSRIPLYKRIALLTATLFLPAVSHAQGTKTFIIPVEMSMTTYLIIGSLLTLSITMFFVVQRRFRLTTKELNHITGELNITRDHLTQTGKQLDQEKHDHQETTGRYTNILFEAKAGMFQMDLSGKCTYINMALQEMSGLYPKKALKEGLESAIHPDDKKVFMDAWDSFTKEENSTFEQSFRFLLEKGQETHVVCKANKILDSHKDAESYIGWVTNVTPFHEEVLVHQAETARFEYFISEAIEGFYKLIPESPISLDSEPETLSENILNKMAIGDCNDTFASMYGSRPGEMRGKTIGELTDGCGPFNSFESIQEFIRTGYQTIDVESIRQDISGNRLNLINNVIGIIEDNKLIGIWGTQRNISKQKRETAELTNKVNFLRRILNSLPADVHVKDTRCRYLYASKKLADRTGIRQEEWIGKTIFEVMPATPREHDRQAIEAMKAGTLKRHEWTYEARGKKGCMENLQIPLISDEGLVEGVVSLSIEISERKKKEEEALRKQAELETKLTISQNALTDSENELSKTSSALSETQQRLTIAELAKINQEHEFQNELAEQKSIEDELRRNEQGLLARQQQLEEKLSTRLEELQFETDKRVKWEELLKIKEDELYKLEENLAELTEHYSQETVRREQAQINLESAQAALDKAHNKVQELSENREHELEKLNADHTAELEQELNTRKKAENQLARTKELLKSTQNQVKRMNDEHATELEKEVIERKETAEKLILSMQELDELRLNFNQRIEEDTKSIKQELARKQIREKALRQHEKDLEDRIKDLETTLQLKSKEFSEQLQAREGAENEKNQIEQKMEQLTKQQQDLVDRKTEMLHLDIAEIRLHEVKLSKRVSELEADNEQLSENLRVRENFLEKARQEQQKTEAELIDTQAKLKQLMGDQSKLIAEEKAQLLVKLESMNKFGDELKERIEDLQHDKQAIQNTLDSRTEELSKAAHEYRNIVDAYKAAQNQIKEISEGRDDQIARETDELKVELKKLQRSEQIIKDREAELTQRIESQQNDISKLNDAIKNETDRRYEAEKTLKELEVTLQATQENADLYLRQQTESLKAQVEQFKKNEAHLTIELELAEASVKQRDNTLSELKKEHEETTANLEKFELHMEELENECREDLNKSIAEMKRVGSMNDKLLEELNEMVQQTLNPIINTSLLLEKSDKLSDHQQHQLANINYSCRTLIDSISYRTELTLSSGTDDFKENTVDLHELFKDIDQQFSHRAETNNLFFAVSYAQSQESNNVPKQVEADESKLRKTLSILLGYALNKTEKGRLGLHTTCEESQKSDVVDIAFHLAYTPTEKKDELLIGIFDAEEEGVVDLKYGLTLARRYIHLMGGKTQLTFKDAGVTELTITLPFKYTRSDVAPNDDNEKRIEIA